MVSSFPSASDPAPSGESTHGLADLLSADCCWGQITKQGKEHALIPYWRGGDLWTTACQPRDVYPRLTLYSVDAAPSGGYKGPCIKRACCRRREAWLRVHNEGSSS